MEGRLHVIWPTPWGIWPAWKVVFRPELPIVVTHATAAHLWVQGGRSCCRHGEEGAGSRLAGGSRIRGPRWRQGHPCSKLPEFTPRETTGSEAVKKSRPGAMRLCRPMCGKPGPGVVGVGLALPSFRFPEIAEGYGKPYPYAAHPSDSCPEGATSSRRSLRRSVVPYAPQTRILSSL